MTWAKSALMLSLGGAVLATSSWVKNSGSHYYELAATSVPASGNTVLGSSSKALPSGLGTEQQIVVLNTGEVAEITITTATADLDAFIIETQSSPNGPWVTLLSGTDFDTATHTMVRCTTSGPHEITAGNSAQFVINFDATYAFRMSASATGGTASVTAYISVRDE